MCVCVWCCDQKRFYVHLVNGGTHLRIQGTLIRPNVCFPLAASASSQFAVCNSPIIAAEHKAVSSNYSCVHEGGGRGRHFFGAYLPTCLDCIPPCAAPSITGTWICNSKLDAPSRGPALHFYLVALLLLWGLPPLYFVS